MPLSSHVLDRLRVLSRQIDLRRRQETEAGVRRLGQIYDQILAELKPYLDATAKAPDMDALETALRRLDRLAREKLSEAAPQVEAEMQTLIQQAAEWGFRAPEMLAAAAVSPEANLDELIRTVDAIHKANQRPNEFFGVGFEGQAAAVAAAIEAHIYQDGLNLSRRIHHRTALQQAAFNRTITDGIKQGRAAVELAKKLEAIGGIGMEMPKYLDAVIQAARSGDATAFGKAWGKAWKIANERKPGPLGVRDVTRQFLSRMRKATADQIDEAARDWLHRKAVYQATVIARHETNEAARRARKEAAKGKPWIRGLRWTLSRSHPRYDVCDELASANDDGLGPGVYPPGNYPETPHPACMCHDEEQVDAAYFDDQTQEQIRRDVVGS